MPHQALRRGRTSLIDHAYHVTFTTQDRLPIFKDFSKARTFIQILKTDQELGFTETLCFVVMPDHVHWLFVLKKGELAKTVKRVKSIFSGKAASCKWGYGFHDHAIRNDESLVSVARYIVANPLRAGLVDNVADYPHWDSVWM